MVRIRLEIVGMSYSQSQSGAYALILGEVKGNRRLPIIIGGAEAQAIAVELEKIKPTRPLTHDLFKNFADTYHIQVKEVIIDQFRQGVFHAKLVCMQNEKESLIDSRTSDAVALAIRFKCPIYTYEKIMAEAGMIMDENANLSDTMTTPLEESSESSFKDLNLAELEELLQKAVDREDYEKASQIRDEIKKRKKG
ncbi:MAG TPA: bifunctional nuclease family protein [Bacteroidales bacterium]|nr:bifunctional nuclease family protein [Bacteroidales bacterium]HOX78143.1 bifunctional nuclease family protein [Bacteroidales bacterium]HPI87075.1 bifunctional nuclease family protein [Bacteroidales bacterium]HPM93043.1 bifunctional nuclease family protein [Bacteroidales bacterium]